MSNVLSLQALAADSSSLEERASSISIGCHTSNASGFSWGCVDPQY